MHSSLLSLLDASLVGLAQVFVPVNLILLLAGVAVGAIVGILPGVGATAALALLLPLTIGLEPTQATALLLGVVAVTATTGDLTSILVGIPGEATAAATVVDGYPMAQRGEASRAIGAALASSLGGAIFGAAALAIAIPAAAALARTVASPELFMMALLGVTFMAPLSADARFKGLVAGGLGLALATVGLDPISAVPRYTFDQLFLWDGLGLVPVALGLFAIPEIVQLATSGGAIAPKGAVVGGQVVAGMRDALREWPLVLRSSAIGTAVGLLPGMGASVSQWVAYGHAARRDPGAAFGSGAVQGVIAPAAANNATLGGALVPTLALGVPGSLSTALLLSALVVQGVVPGLNMLLPASEGGHLPMVFQFVWLLVVANVFAVALSLLAAERLARITTVPGRRLAPMLIVLTLVGAFAERNALTDVIVAVAMGAVGLIFVRYDWPRAPLILGLVLGPLAENRLFLSIAAYGSGWLLRPGVIAIAAVMLLSAAAPLWRRATAEGVGPIPLRQEPRRGSRGETAPGEIAFMLALTCVFAIMLVQARTFPPRAALFPALTAGVGLLLLLAQIASSVGRVRAAESSTGLARAAASAAWIGVYVAFIWLFGYVPGAPAAVFLHMLIAGKERVAVALAFAAAVFAAVQIFMRLLSIPFPDGLLLSWMSGSR